MGVEKKRRARAPSQPGSHGRPPQGRVEGEEPDGGEEGDERVHPGLGAVVDGERRGGDEDGHGAGDRLAAETIPGDPDAGQGRDADDPGERTGPEVRLTRRPSSRNGGGSNKEAEPRRA